MDAGTVFLSGLGACILLIILWEICCGYQDFLNVSGASAVKVARRNWFIRRYTCFIVVLALGFILYGMFQVYQSATPRIHILNKPSLTQVIRLSKTSPILLDNSSEINSSDTVAVVLRQQGVAKRHACIKYDWDRNAWEIEKLSRNPVIIKRADEEIQLDKAVTSSSIMLVNNDKIQLGGALLEVEIPSLFAFSSRNGFLIGTIFAVACLVTLGSIINRIHTQNYFLFPVVILLSGLGLIMMYKLTLISTEQFVFLHFIKLLFALLGFMIIIIIPNSVWFFLGRSLLSAVRFPFRLLISIRDMLQRNRNGDNLLSVKYSRSNNYPFSNDSIHFVRGQAWRGNPYSTAHFLLAASMILLLLPIAFGGRQGITLGFVRIQPTEFAKIILIYYFTILICLYLTKADNLSSLFKRFRLVSPILIMMIIPAVALAALRDFGPILLLYAIILVLFYIGSSRLLEPVITTIFLLCTCVLFILFKPNSIVFIAYFSLLMLFLLINPHLRILGLMSFFGFILLESGIYFKVIRPEHFRVITERLQIWENPWGSDKGLQLAKSLWLIRDSGWLGSGFNWNDLSLLPPAFHTDFIFTVIVATFGFAGAIFTLTCYLLIAYAGLKIVASSFDNSISTGIKRSMLIGGIVFAIGFQAFVIIAGNVGILPLTGITLPLLSYGGSSLLATFILIGLMYKTEALHV